MIDDPLRLILVLSTNDDLYEGSGATGWQSGNFSAPKVGVVQFWDNHGSLGMVAYGT